MKKRVLAVLICAIFSMNLLIGCGSEEEEVVEEVQEVVEEQVEAASDMCSDADFAALQEAYAALAEEYNAVVDFYQNTDEIAQDDEVESLLAQAKEYMDMVGEIQQNELSPADAETLADSMVQVADGLAQVAEGLGVMAENGAACSDESFAALQEAYGYLTEEYNTIVDEYQNNDSIAQNSELEDYLAQAKSVIEEIGAVEQDTISEADAASIAESMTTLADSLAEVANAVFN